MLLFGMFFVLNILILPDHHKTFQLLSLFFFTTERIDKHQERTTSPSHRNTTFHTLPWIRLPASNLHPGPLAFSSHLFKDTPAAYGQTCWTKVLPPIKARMTLDLRMSKTMALFCAKKREDCLTNKSNHIPTYSLTLLFKSRLITSFNYIPCERVI